MATLVAWSRALGKRKLWNISNEWRADYRRSTALASVQSVQSVAVVQQQTEQQQTGQQQIVLQQTEQPAQSRVDNILLRYKPSLRYQKNKLTLRLKGELAYRNIHRKPSPQGGTGGGLPTDLWDFSYGLYAQYKLPWQLTIDTDLQMHSRRGYSDEEMNDNRLYWDASLTKSLAKGRWLLKLNGYDLLGQVSNLRYSINAQGRTETWNNVLRRYVMLTASYRFTQKPKKK